MAGAGVNNDKGKERDGRFCGGATGWIWIVGRHIEGVESGFCGAEPICVYSQPARTVEYIPDLHEHTVIAIAAF